MELYPHHEPQYAAMPLDPTGVYKVNPKVPETMTSAKCDVRGSSTSSGHFTGSSGYGSPSPTLSVFSSNNEDEADDEENTDFRGQVRKIEEETDCADLYQAYGSDPSSSSVQQGIQQNPANGSVIERNPSCKFCGYYFQSTADFVRHNQEHFRSVQSVQQPQPVQEPKNVSHYVLPQHPLQGPDIWRNSSMPQGYPNPHQWTQQRPFQTPFVPRPVGVPCNFCGSHRNSVADLAIHIESTHPRELMAVKMFGWSVGPDSKPAAKTFYDGLDQQKSTLANLAHANAQQSQSYGYPHQNNFVPFPQPVNAFMAPPHPSNVTYGGQVQARPQENQPQEQPVQNSKKRQRNTNPKGRKKCACEGCVQGQKHQAEAAKTSDGTTSSSSRKRRKVGVEPVKENLTPDMMEAMKAREWKEVKGYWCNRCNIKFPDDRALVDHMVTGRHLDFGEQKQTQQQ